MSEEIYKKLSCQSEKLQDELLSCMTNLNLWDHLTPDELGMTDKEIIKFKAIDVGLATKLGKSKARIDHWLSVFDKNETSEKKMEELLMEFTWLRKKDDPKNS